MHEVLSRDSGTGESAPAMKILRRSAPGSAPAWPAWQPFSGQAAVPAGTGRA